MILRNLSTRAAISMAAFIVSISASAAESPYKIDWARQSGSADVDYGRGVAIDESGNAFMAGFRLHLLNGPNGDDALLTKYDPQGTQLWSRTIPSTQDERGHAVAVDSAGNSFIGGQTIAFPGPHLNAFLYKYDPSGNQVWSRQLGTTGEEAGTGVAVDNAGNAFITGHTSGALGGPNVGQWDAFLAKYDPTGTLLWNRQLGTSGFDESNAIALDTFGNPYITGSVAGSLGGQSAGGNDAFVTKFDTDGNVIWHRQLGSPSRDVSKSIAIDTTGNIYISGDTFGALGGAFKGVTDAFVAKLDSSGVTQWIRQLGTSDFDEGNAVAVDSVGNVFLGGHYVADFANSISKFDRTGNLLWTQPIGLPFTDNSVFGIAIDSFNSPYVTGSTWGSLYGPNAGLGDAFLIRYEVPEPTSLGLLLLSANAVVSVRWRPQSGR